MGNVNQVHRGPPSSRYQLPHGCTVCGGWDGCRLDPDGGKLACCGRCVGQPEHIARACQHPCPYCRRGRAIGCGVCGFALPACACFDGSHGWQRVLPACRCGAPAVSFWGRGVPLCAEHYGQAAKGHCGVLLGQARGLALRAACR